MLRLGGEDVTAFAKTLVPLLDGTRSAEQISSCVPEFEADSVLAFLSDLEHQGFVEQVSDDESWPAQARFLAAWRGREGDHMRDLRAARVVVAGLEPWGVAAACELAASGVGSLHLCDDRLVHDEDVTANRIFSADVSGQSRADAVARVLAHEAPSTNVTTRSLRELTLVDGDCDLVVGTLAPDELGSWLDLARSCHHAGVRSLSGCLQGTEAVVGPLVMPGRTACWNCSRLRQLANAPRPEDERTFQDAALANPPTPRPRAYLAAMPAFVGQLIALEAIKALITNRSPLAGRVLIHDLMTAKATIHPVVRVPWCEVCREPPAGAGAAPAPPLREERQQPALDGLEEPDDLRALLPGWVDERVGVIHSLSLEKPGIDEPPVPVFASATLSAVSQAHHRSWQPEGGAGKGLTRVAAAISAVGEAIERYSAWQWRPEAVRRASLGELDGDVLDPTVLGLYSDEQYDDPDFPYVRFNPEQPIDWLSGRWLDDDSPVWVPALAAHLHYPAPLTETFWSVTTQGLAAGASADDAALRAALELVERDSFMLGWLSMSPPRPLVVGDTVPKTVARVVRELERRGARIELYLLDAEVPIPVVACLSLGDGEQWPGAVLGLGADLSPVAAVRKAVLEQAHVGLYLRRAMRAGELEIPAGPEEVRTERDHMAFYVPVGRAAALDFWRDGARETVELGSLAEPEANSLATLRNLLGRSELRLAVVDVTAPDVAETPFRVARAVGAGIQQLHFGSREAQLGNPRLKARATRGVNPNLHPLG